MAKLAAIQPITVDTKAFDEVIACAREVLQTAVREVSNSGEEPTVQTVRAAQLQALIRNALSVDPDRDGRLIDRSRHTAAQTLLNLYRRWDELASQPTYDRAARYFAALNNLIDETAALATLETAPQPPVMADDSFGLTDGGLSEVAEPFGQQVRPPPDTGEYTGSTVLTMNNDAELRAGLESATSANDFFRTVRDSATFLGQGGAWRVYRITEPGLTDYCLRISQLDRWPTIDHFKFNDPLPGLNHGHRIAVGYGPEGLRRIEIVRFQEGTPLRSVLTAVAVELDPSLETLSAEEMYTGYFSKLAEIDQENFDRLAVEVMELTPCCVEIDPENIDNLLLRDTFPRFGLVDVSCGSEPLTLEELSDPETLSRFHRNTVRGLIELFFDRQRFLSPNGYDTMPESLAKAERKLLEKILVASRRAGLPLGMNLDEINGTRSSLLSFVLTNIGERDRLSEVVADWPEPPYVPKNSST